MRCRQKEGVMMLYMLFGLACALVGGLIWWKRTKSGCVVKKLPQEYAVDLFFWLFSGVLLGYGFNVEMNLESVWLILSIPCALVFVSLIVTAIRRLTIGRCG